MAAALVQHLGETDRNGTGSPTTTITMSKTVTLGNTIVVGIVAYDALGADPSVIDSLGNAYSIRNLSDGTYDAAIFSAHVTSAGTLTSITITTASTRYTAATAAEFSGVGAFAGSGDGTATGSGSPQTGIVSKDIPADGIAVWVTGGNVSDTYSAGSSSGSPSATPVLVDAHPSSNMSIAMLYALGGAGGTTGFTGNTATAGAGTFSNAGALFDPASAPPSPGVAGLRSLRTLRTMRGAP